MLEEFDRAVKRIRVPQNLKNKRILIRLGLNNKAGYLAALPLAEALKRTGTSCVLMVSSGSRVQLLLETVWKMLSQRDTAAMNFLSLVDKRFQQFKEKPFLSFVSPPTIILRRKGDIFFNSKVRIRTRSAEAWASSIMLKPLEAACMRMLRDGFKMKTREDFMQIVTLLPLRPKLPREHYLESYLEALALQGVARKFGGEVTTLFLDFRRDPNLPSDPVFQALTVFLALEHEKSAHEPIFEAYSELSRQWKLSRLSVPPNVWFGFIGEGYLGKDVFGESIGYPTPNGETRWQDGFKLLRKHDWYRESESDGRKPLLRFAITETLPVETFSRTIDVSYHSLKTRCAKIKHFMSGADSVVVKGRPVDGFSTELVVTIGGRQVRVGDGMVNMLPKTNYGNFPDGEVFLTPEAVKGVFVADEVIVIDRSYVLRDPVVIKMKGNEYEVAEAPRKIERVLEKERAKAWKRIETWEAKGVDQEIVELNKSNFMNIGEFALGVNPRARVSPYLIEAEKIDRTVHMALGSGYEPDRNTTYHWDAVAGWNQRLDISVVRRGESKVLLENGRWAM